jgi:hypothetical protein
LCVSHTKEDLLTPGTGELEIHLDPHDWLSNAALGSRRIKVYGIALQKISRYENSDPVR